MDLYEQFPLKTIDPDIWRQAVIDTRRHFRKQPMFSDGINANGERYLCMNKTYIHKTHEGLLYESCEDGKHVNNFSLYMHQFLYSKTCRFPIIKTYLRELLLNLSKEKDSQFKIPPAFDQFTEQEDKENFQLKEQYDKETSHLSPKSRRAKWIRKYRPKQHTTDNYKVHYVAKALDRMTSSHKFKNNKHMAHTFAKFVRTHLFHEETYRLALRFGGFRACSGTYNLISENLGEVTRLAETSPSIVSAWVGYKMRQIESGQYANLKKNNYYLQPEIYCTESIPGELRKYLEEVLSDDQVNTVWRYVCRLKPSWAKALFREISPYHFPSYHQPYNFPCYHHGRMMYLFAKIGDVPRLDTYYRTIAYFLKERFGDSLEKFELLSVVLRKVFRESYKLKGRKTRQIFWLEQVSIVLDWVRQSRVYGFNHTQKKAPWSWFLKQALTWKKRVNEEYMESVIIHGPQFNTWRQVADSEVLIAIAK